MRALFVLSIALLAVPTVRDVCATLVPGSKQARNDCLIEADVADTIAEGPTRVRCTDGDACDHDEICANRSCRFRLRVCLNQGNVPGCVGRPIARGRAAVKVPGKKKTRLPLPADRTGAACGPFVDVDVPSDLGTVKTGRKKRKARPDVVVLLRASGKRVDRDTIALACSPTPGACAAGPSQDPITPDHPLWIAMQGGAVVDGVLDDPDWRRATPIIRSQAWRDDGVVTIRLLYSEVGLLVSAAVADRNLWADGVGGGQGSRWDIETDDSVTFYVDPDESRDQFFQPGDRAFGVNLGNPGDPINGPGHVRRCKYVNGDGTLVAGDLLACGDPVDGFLGATGIRWATTIDGTVNDASDVDRGWTTEMLLPWAALNMVPPRHGRTIGGNFDVVFDNDGGERNYTNNYFGPDRFTLPTFVDDHVQGAYSSFHDSLPGLQGPINYATVMFVDAAAADRPAAITDLTLAGPSAYGARATFTAPAGTTGGSGHVTSYEVRLASSPIVDEASWNAAAPFPQRHRPRLAGLPEMLRLSGLAPSTSYWVAVRARDAAGHLGDLSNTASTTTTAPRRSGDRGRVIPAPNGTGLAFEDGTPFVPIGEHLGMAWGWFRNLFPGDVWDAPNQEFANYFAMPGVEGPVGPHLDALAARGVNTLRVFLERLDIDQTGNPEQPRGRYWIESPAGTFNPDMRRFVLRTLEEAGPRGIYVILSPFDTYTWPGQFAATPWFVGNGGPLSTLDDFFQEPATLGMARRRLRQVMDWVAESPWSDHVLGWEPLNEWENLWTRNAEGDAEPGRVNEMRRRAIFVHALQQFVHEQDPGALVFGSMARLDPRGPLARIAFYDRSIDVLAPHFYSSWNEEPINAPVADVTARAANENARRTAYWTTNRIDSRPLLNGEWGLTGTLWPGGGGFHGAGFTQEDDEALFRGMTWSGLAGGQAGQGLRLTGLEMESTMNALTPAMGEVQRALRAVVTSSILAPALVDFAPETLMGRIGASSDAGAALLAWGVSDGARGIAYVVQDRNLTSGTVSDGRLVVRGLEPGVAPRVEYWATAVAAATPIAALAASAPEGVLSVPLPPFTHDVLVVFAP